MGDDWLAEAGCMIQWTWGIQWIWVLYDMYTGVRYNGYGLLTYTGYGVVKMSGGETMASEGGEGVFVDEMCVLRVCTGG